KARPVAECAGYWRCPETTEWSGFAYRKRNDSDPEAPVRTSTRACADWSRPPTPKGWSKGHRRSSQHQAEPGKSCPGKRPRHLQGKPGPAQKVDQSGYRLLPPWGPRHKRPRRGDQRKRKG